MSRFQRTRENLPAVIDKLGDLDTIEKRRAALVALKSRELTRVTLDGIRELALGEKTGEIALLHVACQETVERGSTPFANAAYLEILIIGLELNSDRSAHGMRKSFGLTMTIAEKLQMSETFVRNLIAGLRVSGALLSLENEELKQKFDLVCDEFAKDKRRRPNQCNQEINWT